MVFQSEAANLVNPDTNSAVDVFVRNRHPGPNPGRLIRILQVLSAVAGIDLSGILDATPNGRLDMGDAVYYLQVIAALRAPAI